MLAHLNGAMMQAAGINNHQQQHPSIVTLQPSPSSVNMAQIHGGPPPPHLTPLYGPGPVVVEDYGLPNSACSVESCIPESSGSRSGQGGSQQKKRKVSDSSKRSSAMVQIKSEPGNASPEPTSTSMIPSCEGDFGFDYNGGNNDGPSSVYLDSTYQCIRFQMFQQPNWHTLYDVNLKEL